MSFISCPHCKGHISFGKADEPLPSAPRVRKQQNGQITPLTTRVLGDIHETLRRVGAPARLNVEDWYTVYLTVCEDREHIAVTKFSFVQGLKRYGLERWRTKSDRGWILNELPEPLKIEAKAKERLADESYRQTVAAGGPQNMLGAQPAPAPREETVELAEPDVADEGGGYAEAMIQQGDRPAPPRLGKEGWRSVKLPWE